MATVEDIQKIAANIVDPEIGRTLADLSMVGEVEAKDDGFRVEVVLPTHAYPEPQRFQSLFDDASQALEGIGPIHVQTNVKTRGKDSGGRIGLNIRNVIAVGSGKGGVGKSTVAAALACGLHSYGSKVGLMDADVYGPSIPHMLGAAGQPAATEHTNTDGQKFIKMPPIDVEGLKLMSMGFFVDQGSSVVWRGPMLHKALTQFLQSTDWGELDYLIIDLPPGTGDVSLTLSQQIGLAGAVVVCTPQQVALLDAIKAVDMYQKVSVPVLGFVENMTGEIFGRGGAKKVAEELKVPFLGEVPIDARIREYGDAGKMMALLQEESPSRDALRSICQTIAMQVAKDVMENPTGPTLEIL